MSKVITVFGYGPTGRDVVRRLLSRGDAVRVAQRSRPDHLPDGASFVSCDVLKRDEVVAALDGAAQAVVTTGFAYDGRLWLKAWPQTVANLLDAAEAHGVRVVQVDNLYMYGPQDGPIHEGLSLTSYGRKPRARAKATRMWMEAAAAGRVEWAALRAPDFYGPGVDRCHIGETGFGRMAQGKAAMSIMPPDVKHSYAYVPDIGRAVVTLLDAPDEDFNQAWHVPCAPAMTPREMLGVGAEAMGRKLKISAMPGWLLGLLAVVSPMLRELHEMRFTWSDDYIVDDRKWRSRFWDDPTPLERGLREAALSFVDGAAAEAKRDGAVGATMLA